MRPELVVAIAFAELQRSNQYPAGMVLRFARVQHYRNDKTADQADILMTVRNVFESRLRGIRT